MSTKRSRQLKNVAYELELQYIPEATEILLPFLLDFKLFDRGKSKRIRNVLYQEHPMLEFRLHIFDYHFRMGSGNTQHDYKQTVFFLRSKKLGLPQFWMKPEQFFHKVGEFLRLTSDIDFEEHPDFSKQYRLKSTDEDYLRATMDDDILHFFTINKSWCLEGVNYYLVFYKNDKLISPDEIVDFYQKGLHLAKLLEAEDPLASSEAPPAKKDESNE